jgi:endo-1,4-beta-xylanase
MRLLSGTRSFALGLGLLFLATAACNLARAGSMQSTLPANHSLIAANPGDFQLACDPAGAARSQIVSVVPGPGLEGALRVTTLHRTANEYNIQLKLPLPLIALKSGDVVWVAVWARMLHSGDESGQGVLGIVLEQKEEPFSKLVQHRVSVGTQWQEFAFPARVNTDYTAGSLQLALPVGAAAQTLEIGGVQFVRFDDAASIQLEDLPQTRITYGGRESDASWRKAADERIEQIRKSMLSVHVVDGGGRPVAGATVTVEMRQHAFPFGCAYDPNEIAGSAAETPEGRSYAEHFAELFNVGVDEYAMGWRAWQRRGDRALATGAADWMTAHGIRVRGHCLVWPGWRHLPAELNDLQTNPSALAQRVDRHIREEVSAFAGRLTEWDVINEPYDNSDLMNVLPVGYGAMAAWFKAAHQADPSPRLLLNEAGVPTNPSDDSRYDLLYRQVKSIQDQGGPIGGLGMEAHFCSTLTSIADLQQIYDRFATLRIPVEITELDVNVNDEQLQADYLRDFLTISFSHPNISGITMWGFVEGHHWRPDAALWRADWKIKPAGQAWLDLVKNRWWTHEKLITAADGSASVRGFLGDYTITTQVGNRSQTTTVSLPEGGRTVELVLR